MSRNAPTAQAPAHKQIFGPHHDGHHIDAAVAGRTRHTMADMRAVVEIHEVGQLVDSRPLQARTSRDALLKHRKHRHVVKELRMAAHAGVAARDAGERDCSTEVWQ
jgi:hypothetical protein